MEGMRFEIRRTTTFTAECAAARQRVVEEIGYIRVRHEMPDDQPHEETQRFPVDRRESDVTVSSARYGAARVKIEPIEQNGEGSTNYQFDGAELTVHAYDADGQVTAVYRAGEDAAGLARLNKLHALLLDFNDTADNI
ncbi:MAG TPA: hypothetical protein VLH86_01400 [Patescibacteria group bacterium]|nr:hypothetical protein [Patescibacteria group bacterium]